MSKNCKKDTGRINNVFLYNVDELENPPFTKIDLTSGSTHTHEITFKITNECFIENQWLIDLIFGKRGKN